MQTQTKIKVLSEDVSVASDLGIQDLSAIKELGLCTIINLRPANERDAEIPLEQAAELIQSHGFDYHHFPVHGFEIDEPDVIRAFSQLVAQSAGPVLIYCRRGNRAANLWAMVELAKGGLVLETLISKLQKADIDTSFLREQLIPSDSGSLAADFSTTLPHSSEIEQPAAAL